MKEIFYYRVILGFVSKGLSVREAHERFMSEYNSYPHPTARQVMDIVNRASRSDDLDPEARPRGLHVDLITDPAEVERRKQLSDRVMQIFFGSFERQATKDSSFPQIDRALQRFRNKDIPGREEELVRVFGNSSSTPEERKQLYTDLILELLDFDWDEAVRPKTDSELVDYYSNLDNYARLQIILESEGYISKCRQYGLDSRLTESLREASSKLMGRFTADLNRLEMINTKLYKDCEPVELYRDPKGLDLFRAPGDIAPFMKVDADKIVCPPSWNARGSVFTPDMSSIIDYNAFGVINLLEDQLNKMTEALQGEPFVQTALSGALIKLPDMVPYTDQDIIARDAIDGTAFFLPNKEEPALSALVTVSRGGVVKWGYCSKQSFDLMAQSGREALMDWVDAMTPLDADIFPGNEEMYVQKHGLSQEDRMEIRHRNEIEKELTQLAANRSASLRDKLALRDKTVAELTGIINRHRDGIADTLKNQNDLSVFKFRNELSEHLAAAYVNYLALQQIMDKGDVITTDEIKEIFDKDFMAEKVDAIRQTPGFKNFVENAKAEELQSFIDKSTGNYTNKSIADMKKTIEDKINGYVAPEAVQPQNDREKILRWYSSLEEALKLQGVDLNNPADRMRVITSDSGYNPEFPGDSLVTITTDYYAFMDRKVNEDGSLGDYVNPRPFPGKEEQRGRFETMYESYASAGHELKAAYVRYETAEKNHAPQAEIRHLLDQLEKASTEFDKQNAAYTEYWDNLMAPTNKWLIDNTRKFDPENEEDFKFIENLYNNSKDGYLRIQTLNRNSRSMVQIGVGKDGLAKTGSNFLEIADIDADPYGDIRVNIANFRKNQERYAHLKDYAALQPLQKVPEGQENNREIVDLVTEANQMIEAQYDKFLQKKYDKYYPDVVNSVKMANAVSVIHQNNFTIPPSDGTKGSWNEVFYTQYLNHFNIFANEVHINPETYDKNGMRVSEISDEVRDKRVYTAEETNLKRRVEQALLKKMTVDSIKADKASELEEMRAKNEKLRTDAENRKQIKADADRQAFFADKSWSMVSTKELMKMIGNLYGKNTGFGSKIFTVACMRNRLYNQNGEENLNALSDVETLNGVDRLITLATAGGNISEEDRAFLAELEAEAVGPVHLPQAFDSMVSMLASTMDYKYEVKDITSPAQAYIADVFQELHTRHPGTRLNGSLIRANGQDVSVSHPDDREAYLTLASAVGRMQKEYAGFRADVERREAEADPSDLSIARGRDILLEGVSAPNIPSVKDYMTFVRKEIEENKYFTPHFENISKLYEGYEYDEFKARMNFEKWVKKEKDNLLKKGNTGEGSYLAFKAKQAAKQCITEQVLRSIVGKEKNLSKAIDYFAQATDKSFEKAFENFGTYCETLKKYPERTDELLNLEFESYRSINPADHVNMQIEALNRENCGVESYMRDLFDVEPGDGSGMYRPENEERAREYMLWHENAKAVKMEVPDRYRNIANFIIMGSFFSHEVINNEWLKDFSEAGGSSGFLFTYDSALSNFFECTITGDRRANMQIIRKNEMNARLMANRVMASNDENQVKEVLRKAARTLYDNIRLQAKTLKDEYRIAQKYMNELVQKAAELGMNDRDLGITPEMREKLNLFDNIAMVNRKRIEAINKVHSLYRDNFFTGEDISGNPELKEAAVCVHGCDMLLKDLIAEFKAKKLAYESEAYMVYHFQGDYDETARVEIDNRANNASLSELEKAFNANPDAFVDKYIESAKADIEKDFKSEKLEDRLRSVLKAPDPVIAASTEIRSPKDFLLSLGLFERNAHFFDVSDPKIADEMRSISEEANRCLTEEGAYTELNIDQLEQRMSVLKNVIGAKEKPQNEAEFYKKQLNSTIGECLASRTYADAYIKNAERIEAIMGVPAGTYGAQLPEKSRINARGVFRVGESIPENYNVTTMLNELSQVSLIHGSKEFKEMASGIKELRSFARRNGNFLNDAAKCEELKELLSLVSNAAGLYVDKKSKEPKILDPETNDSKRFHFAQRVLRAVNVMERHLSESVMRNLEENAVRAEEPAAVEEPVQAGENAPAAENPAPVNNQGPAIV